MGPWVGIALVAGVGSRLRPLTDDRPKCLLEIGTLSILLHALEALRSNGASRVVISTGYLSERVHAAVKDAPLPITFVHNHDFAATQNVVSFARALEAIAPGEAVVKLDGDLVFAPTLLQGCGGPGDGVVLVDPRRPPRQEAMKVEAVAGSDPPRIRAFGKGLDAARAYGESIGLEWFSARAVPIVRDAMRAAIEGGRTDVYYEDVYNDVVDQLEIRAVDVAPNDWIEIDDADDLRRARERFGAV